MPRVERIAAGQALRCRASRGSHAGWHAPAKRADPIRLLVESSRGRVPELVPVRYARMLQSPLAFFRGALPIMAADLAHTPVSGLRAQICGDCHLLNFGGFTTPERRVVFDVNDFDETLPAPWEWDVKRLAASVAVAGLANGFHKAAAREAAERCVRSYRRHIHEAAGTSVLERWCARIDVEDVLGLMSRTLKRRMDREVRREIAGETSEHDFPRLVRMTKSHARIKDHPPLIVHLARTGRGRGTELAAREAFRRYRASLADDRRALVERFELQDVAMKVVGVGSVGTRCVILLLHDGDGGALFLQMKEARTGILEPYAGRSVYANRGQRIVAGHRLMQTASDVFLGWTEYRGMHFYVRQLRDARIAPRVDGLRPGELAVYAECCGWALARAHAKAGDPALISGYLGASEKFDDAIASFAMDYARQTERDYDAMRQAVRAGRIAIA
jgi:uncharacterized protein (DUF2252 family)